MENSISTIEQSMYLSGFYVRPIRSQPKLMKSSLNWFFLGGHRSKARPSSLHNVSWSSTISLKSSLMDMMRIVTATEMISEGKYLMMDLRKIGNLGWLL